MMRGRFLFAACVLYPAAAGAEEKAPPRPVVVEKTVYVPYDQLAAVFEKEGRGIFLPYEEFLRLWQAAQPKPPDPRPEGPPAAAVIRSASFTGAASDSAARFTLDLDVEALKSGWSEVPLPLADVALESVELSSPRALFGSRGAAGQGYALYLPGPGRYAAKLKLSARIVREPGKKTVKFGVPPAAISRLDFTIPEASARVEVLPAIAVTQTSRSEKEVQVLAFLGNTGDVAVSWMPPAGDAADGAAVLFAEQSIRVHLGERILKVSTDIDYRVLRGSADTLRVRMPDGMRLISVQGEAIREWSPDAGALVVKLHSALRDSAPAGTEGRATYRLSLGFERILDQTPRELAVPLPRAEDVLRESGWVVFGHEPGLLARIRTADGLGQLDPAEIPEALRNPPPLFGFRYLAQPLALGLDVETITPVIRSLTTSVISVGRDEDVWTGWIDLSIARAGIFRVEMRVPARWSVDSVGEPGTVDDFQTSDAAGVRSITASLKTRALGTLRLPFRLTAPGSAAAGEATHAPPAVIGVVEDRGVLGVSVPRAFEAESLERTRMMPADVDELFRSGILTRLGPDAGIPLAYSYREAGASVRHRITARRTEVDLLAQHLIEVTDGGIRLTHFLDFEVLHAATDRIAFTAPTALDASLEVEAKERKEVRKTPGPAGLTVWEVVLQAPALGLVSVTARHTLDLKALEPARPFPYAAPLLHGSGVRAEKGFIAIRKEGTLEIAPTPTAMEAIESADLPDKLRRGQIHGAFRYFAPDPALTLALTRYEYQPLATTIVNLIRIEALVTEERRLRSRASLLVQNTERQYLEIGVAPESIITLTVAGKAEQPRKRKDGAGTLVRIPASAGPSGTFPILIVYEEPLAAGSMGLFGSTGLRTIEILEKVPVAKVEVDLWLPPRHEYFGWRGSLRESSPWEPGLWSRFKDLVNGAAGLPRAAAAVQEATPQARAALPPPGIELEIPVRGLVLRRFETLAPSGDIRFFHVATGLFLVIDFLAFAAAAAAAWILLRRGGTQRLAAVAAMAALPIVLAWFVEGPVAEVLASFAAGALAALVCAGVLALARIARERRRSRLALAPDPYLENAPPAPPRKGAGEEGERHAP